MDDSELIASLIEQLSEPVDLAPDGGMLVHDVEELVQRDRVGVTNLKII